MQQGNENQTSSGVATESGKTVTESAAPPKIVVGCDCFDCANSNPMGHLTFQAVDCSNLYPGMEAGAKYRVTRSDGVDFGQMFKRELLDMRAAYGCQIEFQQ